ncbi:ABC transporter permease [Vibrio lentus]|uniref:ABC transporter permease n=1 Tax=Vibrio lentus TaxID=136468 RepID=UPI000C84C9D0|nr:ABC transporter permease [Vibrio lentus]PMI39933.1 spermidine/putrescine ABC transporter permease [Vibrio lentus]PMJ53562.1 spermidine/putrescine ABC transporter permease [Vibrio lentus]
MSRLRNLTNTQWVMLISISFFVLVNLLWLGVPFAMAIIWSLVDPNHPWSYPDLLPQVLSFGRWIEVWETTSLPEALRNSYSVAPAVAILTITLAMPTAYAFGRMEFRGKKLAEMVSLLPMVMPSMILAVFFSAMLLELGLTDPYVNIVIAHAVLALPYAIRILSAGFKAIPQDLIDACSDMGAGKIGTFKHAFLPMLKPSLLASSIFCLVISIEEFNMSYVLGAPDFITVPTILYSFLGYSFIRPDAAVVSLILVIPNVLLMLLIERLLKGNYLSQSTGKA